MKTNKLMIVVACAGIIGSCATTTLVPNELISARETFQRASTGIATKMAPKELHVAYKALAKAEQSFRANPGSYQTRDLSYIAERKSKMAEATAAINIELRKQTEANDDYQRAFGKVVTTTNEALSGAEKSLTESYGSGEMTAKHLSDPPDVRTQASQRKADPLATLLGKWATVKEDSRGMVISLSGSVLFTSGQATLLPEAYSRLDQVADVLLTTRECNLSIEAHTDSHGAESYNIELSQRQANVVRNYLVQREYQSDHVQARGLGEGNPIADNASAEGRARNRRVEIIIERESLASIKN